MKKNNLESKYSPKSSNRKNKSPLKKQNDPLISTYEYKSKNEILKQNSEGKKII